MQILSWNSLAAPIACNVLIYLGGRWSYGVSEVTGSIHTEMLRRNSCKSIDATEKHRCNMKQARI